MRQTKGLRRKLHALMLFRYSFNVSNFVHLPRSVVGRFTSISVWKASSSRLWQPYWGISSKHSKAIPMQCGVPWSSVIDPLSFLLFVNDLLDVLEALQLLFADDVKLITWRTQSMNLHSSLTAAWDWRKNWGPPINPVKCNNWAKISSEIALLPR